MVDDRGISLPNVSEDEYNLAGSKFIAFPPGAKVGDTEFRNIEIQMVDWDTPGTSMKVPVVVTEEGPDKGKEDKISFGVTKTGIWKGKEIILAITGEDMPIVNGHPEVPVEKMKGKAAVGMWQMQEGRKGGDPDAAVVNYPKLTTILAAGKKPEVKDLGL